MMRVGLYSLAGFGLLLGALPASATVYQLRWSGTVQAVEGNGSDSGVNVGDAISAMFQFDDASALGPALLPIGGGTYSVYNAPLTQLSLSVGAYDISYVRYDSTLTYMNDSFASDEIVFNMNDLPGGPFGSGFADVQFQARGLASAIDGSGLGNGLPYERFTPSFFAVFGDGVTTERVYGSLVVTDAGAVPEPATWAMMICGIGLMSDRFRRSRNTDGRPARFGANRVGASDNDSE